LCFQPLIPVKSRIDISLRVFFPTAITPSLPDTIDLRLNRARTSTIPDCFPCPLEKYAGDLPPDDPKCNLLERSTPVLSAKRERLLAFFWKEWAVPHVAPLCLEPLFPYGARFPLFISSLPEFGIGSQHFSLFFLMSESYQPFLLFPRPNYVFALCLHELVEYLSRAVSHVVTGRKYSFFPAGCAVQMDPFPLRPNIRAVFSFSWRTFAMSFPWLTGP